MRYWLLIVANSFMKELISLHVGQFGIGVGSEQWELYRQGKFS